VEEKTLHRSIVTLLEITQQQMRHRSAPWHHNKIRKWPSNTAALQWHKKNDARPAMKEGKAGAE